MEKKTIVKNEIVKNGIHGYSAAEFKYREASAAKL